jgi:hypothetical protein
MLAGSVSGGIWRSEDAGNSWTKVYGTDSYPGITCLVQDTRPGHTNTWYCGTGEAYGNSAGDVGAYYLGNGMYKSIDGGITWESLKTTASASIETFDLTWDLVWSLAVDVSAPDSLDVVYASTTYGGIYRSINGGQTFTKVLGKGASTAYFAEVICTPQGAVYATLSDDATEKGIWRSPDGTTWTKITPTDFSAAYNRITMAYSPQNPNDVYFLGVTPGGGKTTYNYRFEPEQNSLWKYTYLSGNGSGAGGSWQNLSDNLYVGPYRFDDFNVQGGYNLLIAVSPHDPNVIVIGGTNLYRSTDGFTTPNNSRILGGYGESTDLPLFLSWENHHPDQHVVLFHPNEPNTLINGNDGGLYRTNNFFADTVEWDNINNGYITTQFYTVAINHAIPNNIIIGGLQDNGTRYTGSADPTFYWPLSFNYDGAWCFVPDNGQYFYFSTNGGKIIKIKLDEAGNMTDFVRVDPIGPAEEDYLFINPFMMDPVKNEVLYVPTAHRIWVNYGTDVIPFNNKFDSTALNWGNLPDTIGFANTRISAITCSTKPAHRLYIGTGVDSFTPASGGRRVYRVDNALSGLPKMVEITGTAFPQKGNVSCVATDPRDADKVFVVFSNYGVYSLFYSENGGETWDKVAGNLESNSVGTGAGPSLRWLHVMPLGADSSAYFLGTSVGLYYTNTLDGLNTEWQHLASESIGQTVVEMIDSRSVDSLIVVGTHGNGVYSANTPADWNVGVKPPLNTPAPNIELKAYPNLVSNNNGQFTLSIRLPENNKQAKVIATSGNGQQQQLWQTSSGSGQYNIPITTCDWAKGVHYITLYTNKAKKTIPVTIW